MAKTRQSSLARKNTSPLQTVV